MEHLVWIVLGVLCGLSGAYSAWGTIPRAGNRWAILFGIGGGSGWIGGFLTSWFGLHSLSWLTAIGAGYLVTGWVFANLRGDGAERGEQPGRVDHLDLGDQHPDHGSR